MQKIFADVTFELVNYELHDCEQYTQPVGKQILPLSLCGERHNDKDLGILSGSTHYQMRQKHAPAGGSVQL